MNNFEGIFAAHFVADMEQIQDKLTRDLVTADRTSGLVAVVFANAKRSFAAKDILPLVPYWNYRSRDFVTFFFVGYVGDENAGYSEYVTIPGPGSRFSERAFVETIETFESRDIWKYRGDTPLILCRAYLRYHTQTNEPRAFVDLDSIIEFELERAIRKNAIESVEAFFEMVIRVAKETPGGDVHWKLSDILGAHTLGEALLEGLASRLPGSKQALNAVRFFRVKES